MNEWQQQVGRSLRGGIKKGATIVATGRGMGKSAIVASIMRMRYSEPWSTWQKRFSFYPRKSYSGKWIWGKIMVRRNIFVIHDDGSRVLEYASRKEAFKHNLKNE
jgi:hypothetical protein